MAIYSCCSMAARALSSAARRINGKTGFPLLSSTTRRGSVQIRQNHSSNAQSQPEDDQIQNAVHDQVEAALNRKNVETVIPEEGGGPEDAWVPDQETGVFVPADEAAAVSLSGADKLSNGNGDSSSVLDQAVFVREEEMEDVERPAVDMAGDK
uniref:Uncharacterized protein n=1 Tax=Leersia perrieri TaxID=77586 RepID=A0A0D9WL30_9ORYZ